MGDIFDQAATQNTSNAASASSDIFDQAAQAPGFLSRLGSGVEKAFDPNNRVNIPNDPAASDALNLVRDTAINTGKDVYNIWPGFLAEQWHKHTGGNMPIPTPSDEAVQRSAKNVGVSALLAAPEAVEAEGALSAGRVTAPKPATSAVAPAAEDSAPGALSRAWEVAKRRAGHIPGVQAFKDAKYVVSGDGAPEPPAPAAPGVPDNWGKGVYGTPVDLWGKRVEVTNPPQPGAKALRPEDKLLPEMTPSTIDAAVNSPVRTLYGQIPPETGSPRYGPEEMPPNTRPFGPEQQRALPAAPKGAELGDLPAPKAQQSNPAAALFGVGQKPVQATEAPTSTTRRSLQQYREMLGKQLGDSLGAKSPIDNPKAPIVQRGQKTELPEGHTAVDSSALRSYKYDPAKQEFEAWPTSGETAYRYGEVSPDAAKAFEDAPSKGKAFQQIKNSGTLVAKRVNGQWVPIKPARGSIAEGMKK